MSFNKTGLSLLSSVAALSLMALPACVNEEYDLNKGIDTTIDIEGNIEGHTDTKPIHTARFADNWDLSVIRATSVVRILTKDYGVNPLQIVPSGRGEYMPVADNESAEGRSKNRRTEIIIAPKLDELLEILNE